MISMVGVPFLGAWPEAGSMESQSPRTEAELVAACRAGVREAFDELVRRYYDRLFRLAYTMAGPGAAADLVQETFLAALRSFPRFRGEAQLSTWLISILRNQVSLHLRGRRKAMAPLEGESRRLAAPAVDPGEGEEDLRLVFDRVKDLPEDLRETLVLFYVEGLKYAEIARLLECPIGTVRSRLFEARERLKKLCETRGA
ncbi:MAG TPA: sigma-70 family RNA polymerase sigma factor [Planctomycetota bacterium]|nr:sigma-70 family RNA polymerase sigma factor [Planctomycetota bacterium]